MAVSLHHIQSISQILQTTISYTNDHLSRKHTYNESTKERINPPHNHRLRHNHHHIALHHIHHPVHRIWIGHGVLWRLILCAWVLEEGTRLEGLDEVVFAGGEGGEWDGIGVSARVDGAEV